MSKPGEDDDCYLSIEGLEFFREIHGRRFNTLNPTYFLPADDEEIKVNSLEVQYHR
jgi:hypothetical protein